MLYQKLGERCHVHILDKYLSKLPEKAAKTDTFYWQSMPIPDKKDKSWSCNTPCDKNRLSKVVSEMFMEAGVAQKKTNHSLRASGVSTLFEAKVDEKIIQSCSRYKSLDALQCY